MRTPLLGVTVTASALVSCQSVPSASVEESSAMKVEILGFAGCPNTPAFRERVEAAAARLGDTQVFYIDQESLPDNDIRRGYPTPTAIVNRRDIFGLPTPTAPSMGCRMYPGGLPSEDAIVTALRQASRQSEHVDRR